MTGTRRTANRTSMHLAALCVVGLAATVLALADGHGGPVYEIPRSTIDNGGGASIAGDFHLAGSIGQPHVGAASGGAFALLGGFRPGPAPPPAEPCPEDIDGDGVVGFADLLRLLSAWGECPECPEDLDGDGAVDFNDLLRLLSAWGPCP